ncbi:MAG: transposase [Kouleothrix sp.]
MVSALRLALAAWSVFVTTIPPDGLTVTEALVLARARWQIELLFKLWKSHGQIDLVRDVQPWRVLCELYGRLLNQIVQHWLLLVSGWDAPARSWGKAAQTIRTRWIALATAMGQPARLRDALTTLARCIQAGCRKNRRRKHPCTFQRFLMSTDSCVA